MNHKQRLGTLFKLVTVDRVVLVLTLFFSFWLMTSTFGYKDGQIWMDSKLYSDFAAHLPLIRSFSLGWNFPPEYPFFAGEPIRYHYFFYLVVGFLERFGLRIDWALNIPSVLGFWLLLMMIYKITCRFFQSRLAGALAIILFLFNGSLSFAEYFDQHGWNLASLRAIPEQVNFASFGPWSGRLVTAFNNLNIYTNQRHLSLSFGLVLLGLYSLLIQINQVKYVKTKLKVWTLVKRTFAKTIRNYSISIKSLVRFLLTKENYKFERKVWLRTMGLIALFGLMPILHQAGFTILIYFTICLLFFYPNVIKNGLKVNYIVALVVAALSFWFLTTGSSQPAKREIGYLAIDKDFWGILKFWWYNLGVYLPLLPVLWVFSFKRKNPLLVFACGLLVVANTVRLSPDMINNHKLVSFFMIVVVIFTAGLITSWLKRTILHRLVAILIIPSLIFSGILDIFPIINDYSGGVDDIVRSPTQQWILANTPVDSQFLTASYMYSPASMVGRQIYLDYGYHAWSMGYDDHHKRQLLPKLWSVSIPVEQWCELMIQENLDYVIVGPGEKSVEDGRINVEQSQIVREMLPAYQSPDGWRIWQVQAVCDSVPDSR